MRRYARVLHHGEPRFAEWADDGVWLLDGAPHDRAVNKSGECLAHADVALLAPVAPSKIVCIGRNYRAHAEELGNEVPSEPLLFLKPPSSLLGHRGAVELPAQSRQVEHEVELGLVIGQRAQAVTEEDASAHIFGYTIVGDITARDLQKSDKTWTRGKGFDTFCPTGPHVVTGVDVGAVSIRCDVNGETRQSSNTELMMFSPATLVAYISQVMTLEPGDLVATGTPAGVGRLSEGDRVTMSIDGIGDLEFDVRKR